MSKGPLSVTLSEWQKLEALKRMRERYQEELDKLEATLTDILTACAEADFLAQYIGEQAEVKELRARKAEIEPLEKRRQHLLALIERIDAIMPKLADVRPSPPGAMPAGLKRY
ncbi:MAG: hypothetical protein N3B15_05385 [Planctomycetota bacterium]|nr:hypothetical protein [Planctomycetota bacterium]